MATRALTMTHKPPSAAQHTQASTPAHAPDSDEALILRFAQGDDSAFATLAPRYEQLLLGVALGLLNRRRDLAAEAVQEAWVRVIRHAGTFDASGSAKAWLYRITINCCRELWRREQRSTANTHATEQPIEDTRPDAHADPTTTSDELNRALNAMDHESREILLLCCHRGLTHEQAASVLDIPVGTLKTRLYRELRTLRAALNDDEEAN
jgi:RNA polymerase sigma-70 factor (ECF subfamily)